MPASPLDPARSAVRESLLAHVPSDAAEEAHVRSTLRLVETEAGCFERSCFAPGHLTGSAFVVCAGTGRVLLHLHRRLGRWLQVGGHDDGERDTAATALREAREETGLPDLAPLAPDLLDVDVHSIPAGRAEPSHLHFDLRYALVTRQSFTTRIDPGESDAFAWLSLEEAGKRMGEPGAVRALGRLALMLSI